MDPSIFRGPQFPSYIPEAQISPMNTPGISFTDITELRRDVNELKWVLRDQYSSINEGYAEMNKKYTENVRQTDKILTERDTQLGALMKNTFHEFNDRLKDLTAIIKVVESKVVELTEHRFDSPAAMIKQPGHGDTPPIQSEIPPHNASLGANAGYESRFDHLRGSGGTLVPAEWSRAESDIDAMSSRALLDVGCAHQKCSVDLPPVATLSDPESPTGENLESDHDELCEREGETEEPLVRPTANPSAIGLEPPRIAPSRDAPIATTVDRVSDQDPPCRPAQDHRRSSSKAPSRELLDYLFNSSSPLTQVDTPGSQDQEDEEPQMFELSDNIVPAPSSPLLNITSRKRRKQSGANRSRRNKKLRPQVEQVPGHSPSNQSMEIYADTSIWPPVIENSDMDQKYITCDRCAGWFHIGCVGVQGDHEDGASWDCPPCTKDPTRDVVKEFHATERCSRPGCNLSKGEEYFMTRLVGRCRDYNNGVTKYLVEYEGYGLHECTWEPVQNLANDSNIIKEFLDSWSKENTGVDVESIDQSETILLSDASYLARLGVTWQGA